jgi:hypothetical protein
MIRTLPFVGMLFVAEVVTAVNPLGARCHAEDAPEKPLGALIVFDHEGKTNALRITGERPLAILENYFPSYRTQPASDEAGSWEAKYEVYVNFSHGKTYRVLVSPNSRYWSMGRGDFELRGYFSDFVAAMLKEKNPRGQLLP